MNRTYFQRNTIEDQDQLNTDEQSLYSWGIYEFYPAGILLKEQHFDLKITQNFKRFVWMKRTCRRFIFFKDRAQKEQKTKFVDETSGHESSMRTFNYSIN